LQVDRESGAVLHLGLPMDLPGREAAMLRALLSRPGQAISKERLFDLVFPGESEVLPEAVEVVAYRLRKRLQTTQASLVTLRGLGYLLRAAS
jgi:two-component system response regulator TctD